MKEKLDATFSKASEKKYTTIFENSLDAILISSQDGAIYSANPAACRMLGRDEKDICKLGRKGIIEQSPQLLNALRKRRESGKFFGELTFIKNDGTLFPVEVTSSLFTDSDGSERTAMIVRDITERKNTEKALQESEIRYRTLFENSLMGILVTNPDGKLLLANMAYARMYGYENPQSMMEEVPNARALFANPVKRNEVLQQLLINGFIEAKEVEVIRRDGTQFYVLFSACEIRDADGILLYNQATQIDLTERRKSEDKLRRASLYARNLIEASLDPLVTISIEGKITDVNSSTEKITGLSRMKLIGSDFSDYFTDPYKAREGYKIVFSKGEVKDYPLTLRHKNGRTTDVLYNATLFRNENGDIQGVFAAARDITDQKKMEKELRKSHVLLEKLNQHLVEAIENERNQIAMNMHDDLGQKLTAINLDITWLKSRIGVQSKTVREKFEEMSLMIKETIENIKETSSLLRPAILFDLGLVPAIKSHLRIFEKQTGIKCHFYFKQEEFLIDDRISLTLYRILQESMTNIARHSGASKTEVTLGIIRDHLLMIINDNGKGIEMEKVNSIISMGIAGMKERIKSVHGKITFRGNVASGTKIRVLIPLTKEKSDD